MERLWTPWRLPYVSESEKSGTCVFCIVQAGEQSSLMLFSGDTCYVVLNLFPYNNGHLMVVPRRHIASLTAATPEELCELMELTRRAEIALREAYAPHGINMGLNLGRPAGAGIVDHIHMHVVPRWNGDTNFMSIVGQTRVLPEELPQTAEKLRPIFERLSRDHA
jgi:ATP adenylyltransferase